MNSLKRTCQFGQWTICTDLHWQLGNDDSTKQNDSHVHSQLDSDEGCQPSGAPQG